MRNNTILKILMTVLFILASASASAQWEAGVKAGMNITSPDRSQAGRVDETYSSRVGWTAGVMARYSFNDWLALRADISVMDRSHRMDRNITYLDPVHTIWHNIYMMIPVMADFSFGGRKLRGHVYAGAFAGCWLRANREGTTYWMTDDYAYFAPFNEKMEFTGEQQRFTAGLQAGAGLSYSFSDRWGILLDAIYCYDLVSYRKSNSRPADPRYLSSLAVTLGVTYKF